MTMLQSAICVHMDLPLSAHTLFTNMRAGLQLTDIMLTLLSFFIMWLLEEWVETAHCPASSDATGVYHTESMALWTPIYT